MTSGEHESGQDQDNELLSSVTGLGHITQPTDTDFEEADRIIADPNIPCSDLRGDRDRIAE